MSIKRLVPLNAPALPTLPAGNRRPGDLVFLTEDENLYLWDNATWKQVGTGTGGGGESVGNFDGGGPYTSYFSALLIDGGAP